MSMRMVLEKLNVENNGNGNGNGSGEVQMMQSRSKSKMKTRLRREPKMDHKPDEYEDVTSEYHPSVFSALERFLPPELLSEPRELKFNYMTEVISTYLPRGERSRVQRHCDYRERITKNYQPLNRELYTLNPERFFVPSFMNAINENTEESFRSIVSQPSPGVYTFSMLQQGFCELLAAEVENFEKWVNATNFKIMRPNTMNKYGAVLDDIGFYPMLDMLMSRFVTPLARVFYPGLLASTLDSHHGFVVEYGKDRDLGLGFHVDDSEVTLNVCLGKQFTGGDLFFRGVRCNKHVNSETYTHEILDYSHVPGQAVLHAGRHRHGAKPVTSGYRINLILWCRSSLFRELTRHQTEFSSWCGECSQQKQARQSKIFAARKQELLQRD